MNLIHQYDQHGCTIACLAMIINKSYFETRQFLIDKGIKPACVDPAHIGLYEWEFEKILKNYFNIESRWIKFNKLESKNPLLLTIRRIVPSEQYITHCVIYCNQTNKILDPWPYATEHSLENYNVCCCLEILTEENYEQISY